MKSLFASIAVTAALAAATPAFAGDAPTLALSKTASSAKAEAILGAPSALDAIRARQQGRAFSASLPQPATGANLPAFGMPSIAPAILPAHATRPDVFGSVALSVSRTPFDRRWRDVSMHGLHGGAARFAAGIASRDAMERIEMVNRYVNARVAYVDDQARYGYADRWSPAAATLAAGRGDCEDYAIAKYQMLRSAGFNERDLYVVVLKDLVRRADHAVLVVRHEDSFLVLDNGTDAILDHGAVRDYRPILTYSAGRSWTHGYRRADASGMGGETAL